MSTGPGPTRKDDGSHDASVDEIAELLVEDDSQQRAVTGEHHSSDDGLDVMLETPGPVLATAFLPPPPAPVGQVGEESESLEDAGASSNLAYEDLLAKLVLPAKAPEPEPTMPEPSALAPEALLEPMASPGLDPILPSVSRPSSPSFQVAPPSEERTLVTDNPLVAEEQQAAVREGRALVASEPPRLVHEELVPAVTEPVAPLINAAAKSKLLYLMLGALLMLGAMIFATVLIKLVMPTPVAAPAAPVVVVPPAVPQPQPAPPAQVQPLPPTPVPPVTQPPAPRPAPEQAKAAEPAPEESPAEQEKARAHRREGHPKPRSTAPKPAPAMKAPTPAPAPPAPKPAKASKKSKTSGYADPFDN